jgi:hypothetical protein
MKIANGIIMLKKISLLIALALSTNALAKGGVSPYLPLNQAPEFEHNVERLLAVSKNTHIMSKPYKTKDIYRVLQAIRYSYPELYHSLSYQINPHIQSSAVTQAKITLSVGTKEKNIPNQRGQSTKTNLILEGNTYSNFNQYLGVSFGGIANEEGIIPTQSILYLGFEYAQIDIGYREHWYSPFHNSAMLLSTHAEAPPSISISNVKPISDFNIRYDIFISQLSEQKGILKNKRVENAEDREYEPGKPYLFGLSTSFAVTNNLSVSLSRLMQFGGGPRKVSLKDFAEGFFTPGSKDNVGEDDTDDVNFELGDQLGSIALEYADTLNHIPYELYAEIALEDTLGGDRNNAYSFGLFLPYLNKNHSLRIEHNNWQELWYANGIYQDGNRNQGNVFGHWAGDEHIYDDYVAAKSLSLNWSWNLDRKAFLETTFRGLKNKGDSYKTGYELQMSYMQKFNKSIFGAKEIGIDFYTGRDVYGDSFIKLGISAGFN